MSAKELKALVKASGGKKAACKCSTPNCVCGGRNFIDGLLMSTVSNSMYGGVDPGLQGNGPLYFSGIDQVNSKATAGLTQIEPTGKHSYYAKMRGAGKRPAKRGAPRAKQPIVPIHTSGNLNNLNPDIGSYKPTYHGYGGMSPGIQGGVVTHPGLQGSGASVGLQGGESAGLQGGQRVIGGFLGVLAAALAPLAVSTGIKAIKKVMGKGAKAPTATQKRQLTKRIERRMDPLLSGMIARESLKLYPPTPQQAKSDPRFRLADPYASGVQGSGFFGSVLKMLAPALIPVAAKGVSQLYKKITGKGSRCKCTKADIEGAAGFLEPIVDELASVMIPKTTGSGMGPGLQGGLVPEGEPYHQTTLDRLHEAEPHRGGYSAGLAGGTRVSVGQAEYPGSMVKIGRGYQRMDPSEKSARARAKAKSNVWIQHVNKVRQQHPGTSYREILQIAKKSYQR